MILTEEKNYTISLEKEESDSENGLTGNTIELEFSNKELLHEIITCGMPIQRLWRLDMKSRTRKRMSGMTRKNLSMEIILQQRNFTVP